MSFSGFPTETFQFLAELETNNSKQWFDDNRNRYEDFVKAPSFDLIAALAEPLGALNPRLKAEPRVNGSLKRINRDVRFSKDKTPYNPRIHLVFWTGDHPNRSAGMHFVISADGIGFGAGVFGLEPSALAGFRDRICDPSDRNDLLAAEEAARAVGCDWDAPDLKKLPRGFEADDPWEHLLRRKGFVMRTMSDPRHPEWLTNDKCADGIMDLTRACRPLLAWLTKSS